MIVSINQLMSTVRPCQLPVDSLLHRYKLGRGFSDCYVLDVDGAVDQEAFVEAFYTSSLFKIERTILEYFASKPATDVEAKELACGTRREFSAWVVEGRSPTQLLLCDVTGRTRSWLMARPGSDPDRPDRTRLFFGSAVLPRPRSAEGRPQRMGWAFHALLGFHRLYSRLLLKAAGKRVGRMGAER